MTKRLLAAATAAILVSGSGTAWACEVYRKMEREAARDLKQFDRLVVAPLEREKEQFQEEHDREVNGPGRRRERIAALQAKGGKLGDEAKTLARSLSKLAERIEEREQEIEALSERLVKARDDRNRKEVERIKGQLESKRRQRDELRRNHRDARRELGSVQGRLEEIDMDVARHEKAIETITTEPPTAEELAAALAGVREKLKDLKRLKREQEEKVRFLGKAYQLCLDKDNLDAWVRSYREAVVKLAAYGCDSLRGGTSAADEARRDFNCDRAGGQIERR